MRTVLITGCSTGIGNAMARAFHGNGDKVIATARNVASLTDLQQLGCITLALDVTDAASIASLCSQLESVDLLINNAGVAKMGPVADLPLDTLRQQLETNTIAPVALIQALLPILEKSNQAMIVNIGSVSGILTTPFAGAYCASKAAFHALNDALRMELAPLGIQVINVQPGKIKSALGDNATAGVDEWLNEKSRYWQLRESIYERAVEQQKGATTAEDFSAELVKKLQAEKPAPVIRIGNASSLAPLLDRWMPMRKLDAILSKKFGLDRL